MRLCHPHKCVACLSHATHVETVHICHVLEKSVYAVCDVCMCARIPVIFLHADCILYKTWTMSDPWGHKGTSIHALQKQGLGSLTQYVLIVWQIVFVSISSRTGALVIIYHTVHCLRLQWFYGNVEEKWLPAHSIFPKPVTKVSKDLNIQTL